MDTQRNTLIIVDSPFQLLCSIELIKYQGLINSKEIHLIVVNNKAGENLIQIRSLYQIYTKEFDSYKEIELDNKPLIINFYYYLKNYRSIIQHINELQVSTLVLGDYANGYFRHIVNNVSSVRSIAVDDGFGTIQTFNIAEWGARDWEEEFKKLLSLGYYNSKKNNIELFTVFEGIVNYENTIKNNFDFLKDLMSDINSSEESYMIGTPVVEDGIVDREVYLNYLDKISEYLSEEKIIYVPHRRENNLKLKEIADKYEFTINSLGMPVELYFCINKIIPKNIISFFSTSLFNLNKIYGAKSNIISVKIKPSHINKRKQHIENVYAVLSKELFIKEFFK